MIKQPKITIIIPVFNEENTIKNKIEYLHIINRICDVIFVDGNSTDKTVNILESNNLKVVSSPVCGRGAQLSLGAANVDEDIDVILFLHIDTKLPEGFESMILVQTHRDYWGRFDIKLDSTKFIFKVIQLMMNVRAKLTGIATGDQSIFVTRKELMNHLDKLTEHPLMEDIYLSKALNSRLGRGHVIKEPVTTSVRYWEKAGIISTIMKMWTYRLLYFFGVSPNYLYQRYYK
jgi:rSAM/selenodomain-associated transferase 2